MKAIRHKALIVAVWGAVLSGSCIDDNHDNCPGRVRIYFDYTERTDTRRRTGIDPADIGVLDLFAFDENGILAGIYRDTAPEVNKDYHLPVSDLAPGRYRFICWGGLGEEIGLDGMPVVGTTTFEQLNVWLTTIEQGEVRGTVPDLFYASHPEVWCEITAGPGSNDHTLDLRQDTYRINVQVSWVTDINDTYDLTVSDNNGILGFGNTFEPCDDFQYKAPFDILNPQRMKASLVVLLLDEGRSPMLTIKGAGADKPLINTDMIKLILAAENSGLAIDFNIMHVFDIEFRITIRDGIIVVINGWTVVIDPEELG